MAIDPNIITTVSVGELPPAALTLDSLIAHELLDELKSATMQDLVNFVRSNSASYQYEEKTIHSPNPQYISDNFDTTETASKGLGLIGGIWEGWAICNGNNGTPNKDGVVGIGYGALYATVGQFGGEKDHVLLTSELPDHNHEVRMSNATGTNVNTLTATNGGSSGGTTAANGTGIVRTGDSGSDAAHNNMQPYIVELKIMKL